MRDSAHDGHEGGITAEVVSVSGGAYGVEAAYERMRGLADRLDDTGDRLRGLAQRSGRTGADGDLLASTVLSPATAVTAEVATAAATAALTKESGTWEATAAAVRAAVATLGAVDDGQRVAWDVLDAMIGHHVGNLVATPPGLAAAATAAGLVALGLQTGVITEDDLSDLVTDNPWLVEHAVNGAGGLVTGLLPLGPIPLGVVLPPELIAGLLGQHLYPDGPVTVTALGEPTPGAQPASVTDLMEHLSAVAALSPSGDSELNGTIAIQTVTGPDGQPVHIVSLPGQDDLSLDPTNADGDVRDSGTSLSGSANVPNGYSAGVAAAMHQHGIGPDDPVMLVGHSQGGIVAAQLTEASGFTITHVVTAGSPAAQVGPFPTGSNVLSIDQAGDPVPHVDGGPNHPSVNHTSVVIDAQPGSGITTHHGYGPYLAGAVAVDDSRHPSVEDWTHSVHQQGYLGPGGTTSSQIYQIVRAPRTCRPDEESTEEG